MIEVALIISLLLASYFARDAIEPDAYVIGYRNAFKALRLNLSNTNIILSSPHAGSDMPEDIPDRTTGGCRRCDPDVCTFDYNDTCSDGSRCSVTTVQDFASYDTFTEQVADELYRTYQLRPCVIVAGWNRKKVDFNREMKEATFNHPESIKAYQAYHEYLEEASRRIEKEFKGNGLLLDIHQHGQGRYTMVGMRLSASQLNNDRLSPTSIKPLIQLSCPNNRDECIRGSKSLGSFLESNGLGIAYPSSANPKPNNRTFYQGGYITNRYSAKVNVIQTELSYVVRNEFEPSVYVEKYVRALVSFMRVNQLLK